MKNVFQKLTCLMTAFLAIGCSGPAQPSDSNSNTSGDPSSQGHTHQFAEQWSYDANNHWHACTVDGCNEKGDNAAHELGDWQYSNTTTIGNFTFNNPKKFKKCKTCDYTILGDTVLPELRFKLDDPNDPNKDFATKATKSDLSRPKVNGKYTLSNCASEYAFSDVAGNIKVRGNQTAGWSKKAFKIKLKASKSMLGLNGGKAYQEWVLLADAKDTTLIRSAAGLYLSRAIIQDGDHIWASDLTPVNFYLNDQYWGLYLLGEQKEVKKGRIDLAIPEDNYEGVDIGYCFELDHYADSAGSADEASEVKKGADGDPTFRMKYSPRMEQGRPSGPLATGQVNTYTMLSDITDSTATGNEHTEADYTNVQQNGQLSNNSEKTSNSNQLTFIRDRMEKLYTVLYNAAISKKATEINDAGEIVNSSKSVQKVIEQHFNLNSWAAGYIINAYTCPPDLGYSSFYMSYDNTPNGEKKLRYDVPWDFDSNFANRNNFFVNGDEGLYVDNTYNTWLYLLSKLDFFTNNYVKPRWNALRDGKIFENMITLMKTYWADYDKEIVKNHTKWPQNDAAHQPPNNFDEIREPYKDPANYKDAEAETLRWCAKRVNYLESKWGKNRAEFKA